MASEIPGLNKMKGMGKVVQDIANRIDSVHKATDDWLSAAEKNAKKAERSMKDLANSVDDVNASLSKSSRGVIKWTSVGDKLGKTITSLGTSIVGMGLDFLISSIQRVYELKERWAKATGLLNVKMGALTPNMKLLTKTANQWRGTMRGLTDDFELGAALFTEYAATLETTGKHVKEFSKLNLILARGFNLGGKGAGDLTKAFRSMNTGARDATTLMAQLTVDSELLGVNTQSLVTDLADAGDYMVRFGKSGTKSLIQSAVFLKQFNIGLKDTNALMDTFDRFDSAAESTARLNSIFGTTISSMDMMLSQDPAERIEKVRQGLLAQGKTYEKLSYFERRSLAETLNLGEKEIAFLLDEKKAHMSLADFREKAAKKEIGHKDAQKRMQKQLQKTSQTLFAFGAAMDRITVALAKAIHPLLEALGLAKSGSKEFKSFGSVMGSVTDTIVEFFEKLAKSKKWTAMMKDLAKWMTSAAQAIAKFVSSGDLVKWIDRAVSGTKLFLKISLSVFAVWTGGKVVAMLANMGKMAKLMLGINGSSNAAESFGSMSPEGIEAIAARTNRKSSRLGRMMNFGGKAIAGAGIGAGVGSITGGGTTGGTIGGALGGALGMLGGPIGAAVGGAVGGWLGKKGGTMISKMFTQQKQASTGERWERKMDKIRKETSSLMSNNNAQLALNNALQRKVKSDRKVELRNLRRKNKGSIEQADAIREVARRSLELGTVHGKLSKRFEKLAKSSGTLSVTDGFLRQLGVHANKANRALDDLTTSTMKKMKLEELENKGKMEKLGIGAQRADIDVTLQKALSGLSEAGASGKVKDDAAGGKFGTSLDFVQDKLTKSFEKIDFMVDDMYKDVTEKGRMNNAAKMKRKQLELDAAYKHSKELGLLKFKIREAADTQEVKLKLDLKEAKLTKKILDLKTFELAMLAKGAHGELFRAAVDAIGSDKADAARAKLGGDLGRIFDRGMSASSFNGMASGGIVSRPTRALIGEAGPEAIIPLKTLARGRGRMPNKFGGSAAKSLVNYASGGNGSSSSSGGEVRVVAGDVYLDGAKVGRHLVRDMIGNGSV